MKHDDRITKFKNEIGFDLEDHELFSWYSLDQK